MRTNGLTVFIVILLYSATASANNQQQQANQNQDILGGVSVKVSDDMPVAPVLLRDGPSSTQALTHDPNAPPGTSSLAFVFDVTGSMYDDLVQVREGAKRIFATVLAQREKLIYNYVLVPFHDPEVGPVVATSDTQYFQRKLQNLYVQGGGDCPEMAISGIKMALEAALPASFIYVFTDARAKDFHLTDQVLNLVQEKQSQVVFVMTGDCGNRTHPGYTAFEKIASTSSGQVFHLEKSDVNEVLNYVRLAVQTRKVSIASLDREIGGSHVINVPVDTHLHEFTMSLSGDEPEINLVDPAGNFVKVDEPFISATLSEYEDTGNRFLETNGLKPVLNLGNVVVYNVKSPKPGVWLLRTTSRNKHTVRVTGIGGIEFTHGFAPRAVENIDKAHNRPLKGVMTYLLVNVSGLPAPGVVNQIELIDLQGRVLFTAPAILDKKNPYLYNVGPLMPPDGYYFVKINGVEERNYEFQRISLTAINPQTATGPRVYMAGRTTGFRNQAVNLSCSVESRAPYTLFWYKGNEKIGGPLFFRYSETAIWTIPDVSSRDTGEYKCAVISAAGNDTANTVVETKEPPPHIISSKNVTSSLHSTAYLHCRTQTIGAATITWQRRGVPLKNTDHFRVYSNGTLSISAVSRGDEGAYVCHVITPGGDARAEIFLFVTEPPKVNVFPESLYFAERGSFNITCNVHGDPPPEAQWFFNNERIRPNAKYYITYKYDLIVRGATKDDAGMYECRAISSAGQAVDRCNAEAAVPPQVSVSRDREMIGRGDTVTLECQVTDGTPPPKITWFRGGREMTAFRYISINGGRLTLQGAQDADAGLYSCVAENMAGRSEGRIRVDVGSIPSIVPAPDTVTVNIERDVTLQCRAIGHPTPEISWTKDNYPIQHGPKYQILPDGGLLLRLANLEDAGRFTCTATNRFGRQDAVRTLIVTGLVSPVLGHVSPEEQVIEGSPIRLSCVVVLGTPKPTLTWLKDNYPVVNSHNVQVQGEGSGLTIRATSTADEGRYTCLATNAAGNASINVNVAVITKPVIEPSAAEITVRDGERLEIPCKATGRPVPTVSWMKDNRPLFVSSPEYALQPGGTLVVYRARVQDTGSYTCTAYNSGGETSKSAVVKIQSAPVIQVDQPNYSVLQGGRITLPCVAKGVPTPKITWQFNNRKLEGSRSIQQRNDGSLTINHAKEPQKGEYKCIAENVVGRDSRVVNLNVHTAPVIIGSGEVKVITVKVNDTASFPCPANADPPPSRDWTYEGRGLYRGYSYGSDIRFTEDGKLEITSTQMQHAGRYSCFVSNLAGNDSITYILKVEDPPRIVSNVPGTFDVVLGLKMEILCQAVGTPPPVISWQKDGFELISGEEYFVDRDGTLRIRESKLTHAGRYTCTARNTVGSDTRVTTVVVQEPPIILPATLSEYTVVEGDKVEMKCLATGSPKPQIIWYKRSVEITEEDTGVQLEDDGVLIINSVKDVDHGPYTCKAVNPAGEASQDIMLKVIVPPHIRDPEFIMSESVMLGVPFTLYCPVFSTPIPEIKWHLNENPIVDSDKNIHLSQDKRRLDVLKARTVDAGVYKCIARNAAGESSKTFEIEVLVPPILDESKFKRKLSVIQNHSITIGCPVHGIPDPTISWLATGQLLEAGPGVRGLKLSEDGRQVIIQSAQLDHEGSYTCVATNKAGSLDVDIMLTVLAPPSLGDDEVIEVVRGLVVTMNCNARDDGVRSTITWTKDNKAADATEKNVQVALEGRKLYVNKAEINNEGVYTCLVRNSAGESRKNFRLFVLVPPQFKDETYETNVRVAEGQLLALTCFVAGNPRPQVVWEKDGQPVNPNSLAAAELSEDDQVLKIPEMTNGPASRYTCTAKNKAGVISRDFFVETIARPVLSSGTDRTVIEVVKGFSVMMDCPVTQGFSGFEIEWSKEGRPLPVNQPNLQVSLDQQRLHLTNVQEEDEALYMCLAKNRAGEANREFQLTVISPPKIVGSSVEHIEVLEGNALTMRCNFESEPFPDVISWTKDGHQLSQKAQMLNDNSTVFASNVDRTDAGTYFCQVKNRAGKVEKSFHVKVLLKPTIPDSDSESTVEVIVTQPITLDCPVANLAEVQIEWLKDNQPVANDPGVQILASGRHLHFTSTKRTDAARYTCIAKNKAGSTAKRFNLVVLVPPTIRGEGGEHSVVVNQSLTLSCETDGFPQPTITWTKDGELAESLPSVQQFSEGQQFRISPADPLHKGQYICTATNKVGAADVNFDVDVITPPSVSDHASATVEVIVNQSATLKCPVTSARYGSQVFWLRDRRPLNTRNNPKYVESQNSRKLHLTNAQVTDEGSYSCRVKNRAGETTVDFKIVVLEPPKILILDKDKNHTVIENSTVTLSCPASGKPDPLIQWYKEGEQLNEKNILQRITNGQIIGNVLRIPRVKVRDGGRFTCIATNKAGIAEQDISVYVMTPPRIEREGIPSTVQTVLRQRATMSCPSFGRPPPTVTWLKAGRPLTPSAKIYYSANGQKLHLTTVENEDLDRYTCVAKNPAGEDKRDFSLEVLIAPTISGTNLPRNIQVIIGRSAVIECPATGSPEPSISWMKNGQPVKEMDNVKILPGGRQLQISNAQLDDTARYTCIAINPVGVVDLDTFVDVVGPPAIEGALLETVEVVEAQSSTLLCEISGTEPLDVEWMKNQQSISSEGPRGAYLQISSRGRRLHILAAQVSDEGRYTCIGRNRAGEVRKIFDLKVLVPPSINESASSPAIQKISIGQAMRIECKVNGVPFPQVSWRKDDEPFNPRTDDPSVRLVYENQTIWIQRATEQMAGRYTCAASNKVGAVEKDFIIQLKGPPQFDQGIVTKEVNVGDYVILTCQFTGATGQTEVTWLLDEQPTSTKEISPTVRIDDRRVEIREARLSDSGRYTCLVKNEAGEARKHFDLTVLEPPRFLDSTNLSPSIILGRPLILDCSVAGTPKPTVTWSKDSQDIPVGEGQFINDNQQFRVPAADEDDAGRYTCVAENKAGRVEKDLVVEVQLPPKLHPVRSVIEVTENDTFSVECPVNMENVEVVWTKNGAPFTISSNVQVSNVGKKLHVIKAQTTNAGRYTCIVRNEAGEADVDMEVIVLVPPRITTPGFRTMEGIVNQTIQIDCHATGVPEPMIEWSKDGRPLVDSSKVEFAMNGSLLRLHNVQSNQEGRYTCIAINKVGRAEADVFLQVIAAPYVVKQPEEMKVILNQGQTIRCEVHGSPAPEVKWLKNGQPFDSALIHSSLTNHYVHIMEASLSDAGRYTCVARSRAGEDRHTTNLVVLVPPTILAGERVLNVIENRSLTIECATEGVPEPLLRWYKEGRPVVINERNKNYQLSGNRLIILQAQVSDAGRYTCEAKNEAGSATVDFAVDVYVRPHFINLKTDVKVIEGERATLDCNVEAKPPAQITWLRGGRPLDQDAQNFILSPRGHRLMVLSAKRTDAGSYSCVAKNAAGENEASFSLNVMVAPYIITQLDQNPQVITRQNVTIECPVLGVPPPTVEWRKNGQAIRLPVPNRLRKTETNGLIIMQSQSPDKGRYTCHAFNDAGVLDTDFVVDVIAPPKFGRGGTLEYEVIEGRGIVLDCQMEASPKPTFTWLKGDSTVYLDRNVLVSNDGQQLSIVHARLTDGGRYTCKATNVAGTTDVPIVLHVLVPPKIDKSNIIGNPLAIVNKTISLECPATGVPPPVVRWLKDGQAMPRNDRRIAFSPSNQTVKIEHVRESDEGRYTCQAENKAGRAEQDFNLEVLVPPVLEKSDTQKTILTEGESLTLTCPVQSAGQWPDLSWTKDGRPLDPSSLPDMRFSSENRRVHVGSVKLSDAGIYTCVASNRAGETQLEFDVEVLSPPHIDGSRNDPQPHVIIGQSTTLWCMTTGYPDPTVKWLKNGEELSETLLREFTLLDENQGLRLNVAKLEDAGRYTCVAQNPAGRRELDIPVDVWIPPTVTVLTDKTVIPLGQPVTLMCNADGNPEPTLQWSKDGQVLYTTPTGARISMNGRRLDLPRLRQVDTGRYTCTARNEAGVADDFKDIDVLVPPIIRREGLDMNPRVPSGQTITLHCEASGKPSPQISWYKDDVALRPSEKIDIAPGGIYMQIRDANLADKGFYKCEAINDAGEDQLVYNVEIVQLPSIGPGATVQVVEGNTAVLECDAKGTPPPLIMWQRNGQRISNRDRYALNDQFLRINHARSQDAGIYVCIATNEIGTAQQAYTLEVLVQPKIITVAPEDVTVPMGKTFSLKCSVRGYPEPVVVWYKGGVVIHNDGKHVIEQDGGLSVMNAESSDEGAYKCEADNPAGKDIKQYQVIVIRPPTIAETEVRDINVTEHSSVLMACQVQGDSKHKIVWYKGEEILTSYQNTRITLEQSETRLKINDSRLTDSGEYKCVAVNPAGNATQRFNLHVGVPPRITPEPRRIIVTNDTRADLPCEAVGHPPPTITWLQENEPVPESYRRGSSLVFPKAKPDDAAVYTCRATNWAGEAYHDVELVVIVAPSVNPERYNLTVKENATALLECHAYGVPKPSIEWFREPQNVKVAPSGKYVISGSTLQIRNIKHTDDGFYRCVATNEGGVGVGYRKIDVPKPDWKIVWVECDSQGRPIRTTYVPARGDVPNTNKQLLPWSSESQDLPENGTANTLIRCLPPRDLRKQRNPDNILPSSPLLIELPKNQNVRSGDTATLTCNAIGNPPPEILWLHNGTLLPEHPPTNRGRSVLKLRAIRTSQAGQYMCVARNQKGSTKAVAVVRVKEPQTSLMQTQPQASKVVTMLTCKVGDETSGKIYWMKDGKVVTSDRNRINLLANGTLVLTDVEESETNKYHCVIGNKHVSTKMQVFERVINENRPEVQVSPGRVTPQMGHSISLNCQVSKSDPMTTQVSWFHNNLPVVPTDRVQMYSNNTLTINDIRSSDRGQYKCVAYNSMGQSSSEARFIIEENRQPFHWSPWATWTPCRRNVDYENGQRSRRRLCHSRSFPQTQVIPPLQHYRPAARRVFCADIPTEMKGSMSGTLNGVQFSTAPLYGRVVPKGDSNEIQIRIDLLPFNLSTTSRAVLGASIAPCWVMASPKADSKNGYQLTEGHYEQTSQFRFMTGETMELRQFAKGVDSNGYLELEVHVDGKMPTFPTKHTIAMDPYVEYLVQSGPGNLRGYGNGAYRVGAQYSVPYSWQHNITYPAKNGVLNSRAEKVRVAALSLNSGRGTGKPNSYVSFSASAEPYNVCPTGFDAAEAGMYCTDVDECETGAHKCQSNHQCINTAGSYRCVGSCLKGYHITDVGVCADLNECKLGIAQCKPLEECINTDGSYTCKDTCPLGYKRNEVGTCVDIDECREQMPCHPDQTCINMVGSYKCFCQPGFVSLGDHGPCEDFDECSVSPPVCQYDCRNTRGSFTCLCPPNLSLMPDKKSCYAVGFSHGHANHPLEEEDKPYLDVQSESDETMEQCAHDNPCQFRCQSLHDSYECKCPDGYRLASDGHSCEDIDECQEGIAHCSGDKICFNQRSGYQCLHVSCPEEYTFAVEASACILPCMTDGSICPENKPNRVQVQLISLPSGIRAYQDILRLTAYDKEGRMLRRTSFSLSNDIMNDESVDAVPFAVRLVKGRGTVFTMKPLTEAKQYRVKVRATSYDEFKKMIKYQTDFIVFISVSQYPF